MIGGTAYMANKAGQHSAEAAQQEDYQNQQIAQLQAQQANAAAPPPPPPPAAAPATDMVTRLQQLQTLKDQGVLTDAEFDAAKAKVISG
jgi:hypothetical protein